MQFVGQEFNSWEVLLVLLSCLFPLRKKMKIMLFIVTLGAKKVMSYSQG